ncbi:MAG: hypothetical protein KGL53_16915 [Elusimicrobia bacterium]|nr:hypothetical protein [Elusimicrobiota bacterium]
MPAPLLLALALSVPARAQTTTVVEVGTATRTGYEEFSVLGWGQGCSVALEYLRYPPQGQGLSGIPDAFRVGTLTLAPDADAAKERWVYDGSSGGFSRRTLRAAEARLRGPERYERPGTVERNRWAPVADQPGLAALLTSTEAFHTDPPLTGLDPRFRFKDVYYSPLLSCALFVFKDPDSPHDGTRWRLARLSDPGVRRKRARAHVSNALLYYRNRADLYSAEAELAVASDMDPRYALARYYHAVLLTAYGRFDEALASLKVAVQQDGIWARQAREAPEFDPLRGDERFQAVLAAAAPLKRKEAERVKKEETLSLPPRPQGPPEHRRY